METVQVDLMSAPQPIGDAAQDSAELKGERQCWEEIGLSR